MQLRDYQQSAIDELRASLRGGKKRPMLKLPTGAGKCLGKGVRVLMHDGTIKNVEDIRAGDLLMGPDSKPRKVLSTTSGTDNLYRVIPKKGKPYVVNEPHILSLRMTGRS